jgi:cyanophycinase
MQGQIRILIFCSIIPFTIKSSAQMLLHSNITEGPEIGSLVIAGGGVLGNQIIKRFIELAGGNDAPIVVIPTASGSDTFDKNAESALFMNLGATNVSILHTNDRKVADSDTFNLSLAKAKAVWFGGGRQWRLVDAYKDTKTEKMIRKVLERGGVVGGTSAGATIQGSYLVRGDTKNNQIMMGDHEDGFGFIKNIAIDQHVIARNRHFDMLEILRKRPELLGIAIDENTSIIVQGNEFEVIGDGYVIIYDNKFWSREGSILKNLPSKDNLFYFLRAGDRYHLKDRKVIEN